MLLNWGMHYPIPSDSVEVEHEVKKSRFIARAGYADSRVAALQLVAQAKLDYPDARHHCWAYLLGDPHCAASAAMNDDGEPSGTAGKPISNVLQHKGVGDVLVIVIRYFGGIKLGAGGLVRAYSAAAQLAMQDLATEQRVAMQQCHVECDFAVEQNIRHWLSLRGGQVLEINYTSRVDLLIDFPEINKQEWQAFADAHKVTKRALKCSK